MDEFRGARVEEAIAAATCDHRLPLLAASKARGHVERDKERRLARCRPLIEELRQLDRQIRQVGQRAITQSRVLRRTTRVLNNLRRENPDYISAIPDFAIPVVAAAADIALDVARGARWLPALQLIDRSIGMIGLVIQARQLSGTRTVAGLVNDLRAARAELTRLDAEYNSALQAYRARFNRLRSECRDVPGFPWQLRAR